MVRHIEKKKQWAGGGKDFWLDNWDGNHTNLLIDDTVRFERAAARLMAAGTVACGRRPRSAAQLVAKGTPEAGAVDGFWDFWVVVGRVHIEGIGDSMLGRRRAG